MDNLREAGRYAKRLAINALPIYSAIKNKRQIDRITTIAREGGITEDFIGMYRSIWLTNIAAPEILKLGGIGSLAVAFYTNQYSAALLGIVAGMETCSAAFSAYCETALQGVYRGLDAGHRREASRSLTM